MEGDSRILKENRFGGANRPAVYELYGLTEEETGIVEGSVE